MLGAANSVLIPAKLVEGGMEPTEAISSFGVLCGMTMPMLALPTGFIGALCLVLVPNLAQKTALRETSAVRKFLDKALFATSVILAPAMALMTVVGPSLARWAFGEPKAGNLMVPLALGTLLSCWQSILSGALNGIGRQSAAAVGALLSDVVQLGFTWFTVARWGLEGFAAGFVLSSLVGMVFELVFLLRRENIRAKWADWFLCPTLSAVLMGLCANLVFRYCLDNGATLAGACLLSAGLGCVVYVAALQAQGVLPRMHQMSPEIS
jgi:O-antigen/teichoic acid export membrane protein